MKKLAWSVITAASLAFGMVAQAEICWNQSKITQLSNDVETKLQSFYDIFMTKPEREHVVKRVKEFLDEATFFNDVVLSEADCSRVKQEWRTLKLAYMRTRALLSATHHSDRDEETLTAWRHVKVKIEDLELAVNGQLGNDDEDSGRGPSRDPQNGGGGGSGDDNGDRFPTY